MTTIQLKDDTKEALRRLGEKGETYDDIVRRLVAQEEADAKALRAKWDAEIAEGDFIDLEDL